MSDDYHMAEQAWLSLQETAPQRARLGGLKGEGGREREREEAGCEVLPDWARGAIVLVPLAEKEAKDAGVELRAHHIVIVQEYQSHVERANYMTQCVAIH